MHIPARYYKRIPKFYFVVGILLILTSFNMEGDKLAAYLYFISGLVSIIYAVSVHQARARGRKRSALANDNQPAPENDAAAVESEQPAAENAQLKEGEQQSPENDAAHADEQESKSGMKDRDLPQHGGSIAASGQPELKT